MAKQTVGRTALGAATCRLIEQDQPAETRLFSDPLVKDLVGAPIRMLMQLPSLRKYSVHRTDVLTPGLFGAQICRTRYLDDWVRAILARGVGQVVILGAGLDTRPYRLPGLERVRVFEVDLPSVQEAKKMKLRQSLRRLPENVTFLPIDFETQSLESVFAGTRFDPALPAGLVWEGVTQYLSEEAIPQTLAFVGQSARGSTLAFTYVLKSILARRADIPGAEKMLDGVAKNNAPWRFGLDPASVSAYMRPFHLTLVEDVGHSEYQERYLKPVGRRLVVSAGKRMVQATVIG